MASSCSSLRWGLYLALSFVWWKEYAVRSKELPFWTDEERSRHLIGFYVTCNQRELGERLYGVLRQQGYLGYFDAAGRINFVLDGADLEQTGRQITRLASAGLGLESSAPRPQVTALQEPAGSYQLRGAATCPDAAGQGTSQKLDNRALERETWSILERRGFSLSLKGTRILAYILPLVYRDEGLLNGIYKQLYALAGWRFDMSPEQVDRVLRYAVRASGLKCSNRAVLQLLLRDLSRALDACEKGGQPL